MLAEIIRSYDLILNEAYRLVADIDGDQMVAQGTAKVNHPAWIIGHLVYSCQLLGGELGIPAWLPPDWSSRFATGTQPVSHTSCYPSKAELVDALHDGRDRLISRLSVLKEADLDAPLPDERCRAVLPTLGQAVLHILTVHTAYHVGQISAWRQLMELPRVPVE